MLSLFLKTYTFFWKKKGYETAHKIWKTQINESIPLELLNNLACIYSRKGQHEMAASYLEKALNACEPNSDLTFDDEGFNFNSFIHFQKK